MQQPRYGRPRGSGLDDSHQLESIAALLAANPGLKTTTAIRHLGVEDPSAIRRLRDKFRIDQARLMANARHSSRNNNDNVVLLSRPGRPQPLAQRVVASPPTQAPAAAAPAADTPITVEPVQAAPQQPPFAVWCEFGLWAMTTAIEQQAVISRHLLHHPAVENALRAQLAVGAFLVAVSTPRKPLKPRIH
jgi:hypothetical protein